MLWGRVIKIRDTRTCRSIEFGVVVLFYRPGVPGFSTCCCVDLKGKKAHQFGDIFISFLSVTKMFIQATHNPEFLHFHGGLGSPTYSFQQVYTV